MFNTVETPIPIDDQVLFLFKCHKQSYIGIPIYPIYGEDQGTIKKNQGMARGVLLQNPLVKQRVHDWLLRHIYRKGLLNTPQAMQQISCRSKDRCLAYPDTNGDTAAVNQWGVWWDKKRIMLMDQINR